MIALLGNHLATSAVIKSKPVDFLRGYLFMAYLTSLFGLRSANRSVLGGAGTLIFFGVIKF